MHTIANAQQNTIISTLPAMIILKNNSQLSYFTPEEFV